MKKRFVLTLLFCLLWAFSAQAAGAHRALLIGCDDFISLDDTAPSSANNVRSMTRVLQESSLNIRRLMTVREGVGSCDELTELIRMTARGAEAGDVTWFYISTHGLWDGETFSLLLSNGEQEETVSAPALRALFDEIPGRKVLILDACHSGAAIGKGLNEAAENIFRGDDYLVICSGGGEENSWFWADREDSVGAGYFSGSLALALGGQGAWAADENRDGSITMRELARTLPSLYGESTPRFYPESADIPLLTYDTNKLIGSRYSLITGLDFESDVLAGDEPSTAFSFTLSHASRIGYRIVYRDEGRWLFDEAEFLWDETEGSEGGHLTAGWKERELTFSRDDTLEGGYVLLQIVAADEDGMSVPASHVLCVEPVMPSQSMEIMAGTSFRPDLGEELPITIRHTSPCTLTVSIIDVSGEIVRRLSVREPSRPEGLTPDASLYCWDGRDNVGRIVPDGMYQAVASAYIGSSELHASSLWFSVTGAAPVVDVDK